MPQIGGYGYAYGIATFEPSLGWRAVATAGTVKNLRTQVRYTLDVRQRGQRLIMAVDEVPIFDHVLAQPLPGNQLGLFAWGSSEIRFEEVGVAGESKPRAFVAMPYQEPFETLYREVVKPETEAQGFAVVRIDEKAGPGVIFEDMKREIEDARVLIAEITAPNQNVFYEMGYAHALKKPAILLAQRGKELPFDNRSCRVIFYDDTIGGKPAVERKLREHLRAILQAL